ncbi:uncharacterized protein LOC119092147 [Pollicipes pollicipes]|uniref:uncharacterized protein LOC119092147 n=1 Tax=Pollicipes pollicipes TaxID=41117 RepID=UPI001884AB7F|nr:uncharacterized protein LOC119092147 [Pollicipes pollicipes]
MASDKVVLAYVLSLLACLVAMMWQSEVDPRDFAASDEAKFRVSPRKMMETISTPDMIATWFSWIKNVKQIDRRLLTKGKRYIGQYTVGPLGPYRILLTVKEYERGRLLTVDADSWLRPRLQLQVTDLKDGGCFVHLGMTFNRTSSLFQYTVGWVGRVMTNNHFRHSLFMLRMMRTDENSSQEHPDDFHALDELNDLEGVEVSDEVKVDLSGKI